MVKLKTVTREANYTLMDFLSICGALFGLYLGISALSIIEIFCYFAIRLFWSIRQWKSENVVVAPPLKPTSIEHIDIESMDN